ncbi:MAG: hemolysin family protein [Bacteroidia bacterium]|nr:hemolysin family protein [Bacteroidia bacterium]MDW8134828.1 hemolysin family protein [Bacteroidia bacterium]
MSWGILLVLALVLSAWASGSEMGWISANPLHWESWRRRYPYRWRIGQFFLKYPRRLLITLLLANNLALVLFSTALSHLLFSLLGSRVSSAGQFWIDTLLGTLVLLVLGEYLPKVLFQKWQLAILPAVVPFTAAAYVLLFPFVEGVYGFTTVLFRMLGINEVAFQKPLSRESVATLVQTSEPAFQRVIDRALALSEKPVREFMVPRREVVGISIDTPIKELYEVFINTELSRLLVYENTPDRVIGYVYVRSLLRHPRTIAEVLEPVSFVPESMPATRLLEELMREKRSIAVVLDARGGMAGIVTTEDLVEEVFGEIQDEHDEPQWLEKVEAPNIYEFDARIEIDYLNEKYGLGLPTEGVVTLGGLALSYLGKIPQRSATWEAYGFRWQVIEATPQRILTLRLERL